MDAVLPEDTWTRAHGCIGWDHRWRVPARSAAAAWTERLRLVPLLLPGFAVPATAGWVARAPTDPGDRADVRDLPLELVVTADAVTEALVPDGGTLTMRYPPQPGAAMHDLTLAVVLNVDLHARLTRGRYPDNDDLADLNAPRLNAFLGRLRVATRPVDVVGIRAGGRYAAQVTPYGFHPTRRGFDVPAVLELLERGWPVHLTNRTDADWQPDFDDVSVFPDPPGRYRLTRHVQLNDGSGGGSIEDETLDEGALRERLHEILDPKGLPGTAHAVTDRPWVVPDRTGRPPHRQLTVVHPADRTRPA